RSSARRKVNGQEAGIRTRTVRFTGGDAAVTPQSCIEGAIVAELMVDSRARHHQQSTPRLSTRMEMEPLVGLAPTNTSLRNSPCSCWRHRGLEFSIADLRF